VSENRALRRIFGPKRERLWEIRNAYKMLFGKPEEKRPLGRSRRRCEGNIKMDLGEIK
jgi:hypothetical protein